MKKLILLSVCSVLFLNAENLSDRKQFVGEELVCESKNYYHYESPHKKGIIIYNIFPKERLRPQVTIDNKNAAILTNQGFAGFIKF